MLKFGKKVNSRPVRVSALIALAPTFVFITIYPSNISGAILTFIGFFLFNFFIYYLINIPLIFSYWEIDQKQIRYCDMRNIFYRIKIMIFPKKNRLTKISLEDIDSVTLDATNGEPKPFSFALMYSAYLAIISTSLSMANNPIDATLHLKNGQTVVLSMARDFVYDSQKTFEKIDQLTEILNEASIKVDNEIPNPRFNHLHSKIS